jgi:peptide/nickel transport system substrate-binding protein
MMGDIGVKVTLNALTGKDFDNARDSGKFDWIIIRNGTELITVVQNTANLAPTGPTTSNHHKGNGKGELDLLPYEQDLVDTVNKFIASRDPAERQALMKHYQNVYTTNLDGIGLTAYPGALIINKRFANIPAGAPIFMYNWAEDNIIRERVFVPKDKQIAAELHPNTLAGAPGDKGGPISAN